MASELPAVLDLLIEVVEDFKVHFADRLLAGIGVMAVMIPLVFVGMGALYVPMLVGMGIGAAFDDELVMILGMFGGIAVGVLLMLLIVTVPIMPMYASLGRAVLRNLDDGSDLGIAAPFETATQDLGKVLGTSFLSMIIVFGGMMLCYLPGIVAGFALGLAVPAVIVHRLGPIEAIKRSAEHAMAEPIWHLGFYFVSMGITMVLSYIPVIGLALVYPFLLSFQIRAYVRIFGRD